MIIIIIVRAMPVGVSSDKSARRRAHGYDRYRPTEYYGQMRRAA